MQAIVVNPSGVNLERRPDDARSSSDAIIRVDAAVLTGLERAVARGAVPFDGTPGHAFVGTVLESDSPDAPAGTRVTAESIGWCGDCDRCRKGLRHHCRNRSVHGITGRDGALAQTITLPAAQLIAAPPTIETEALMFAPFVASAMATRQQITISGKTFITILGDGPLGLLTAQVLAPLNASVRVIGRYSEKLSRCERWGVQHRHLDDIGRRGDQDVVVDCTGSAAGFAVAMELVRARGTIILKSMAGHRGFSAAGVDLIPAIGGEVTILGSFFGPVMQAIAPLEAGTVDPVGLISGRCNLTDAAAILAGNWPAGMLSTLVKPN